MRARKRFAVGALVSCVLATLLPHGASAALRVPQVAVTGAGLQTFMNGLGESIDVHTEQDATSVLATTVSQNATFTMQLELMTKSAGLSFGFYNAAAADPAPFELFPPAAITGWFAVMTFRTSPVRAVVNVFDDNAILVSTTTYLGADKLGYGFYLDGPDARYYSQDQRNPAGDAQLLFFRGTGTNTGAWWVAGEQGSRSAGADGDFDDLVVYAEPLGCPCPVQRCSWGAVKSRFR